MNVSLIVYFHVDFHLYLHGVVHAYVRKRLFFLMKSLIIINWETIMRIIWNYYTNYSPSPISMIWQ